MPTDEDNTLAEEMARLPRSSLAYKIVTVGMGIIILVFMVYVVVQQWQAGAELAMPVRSFADYLHKHQITAATPKEVARDTAPPASKVYELEIDGRPIWLCYFNPDDPQQREALGQIKQSGTLKVNGREMPVKVRDPVVLAGYDGSKQEAEILRAFDDYETR